MNRSTLIGLLPKKSVSPVLIEQDQDVYDIMNLISFAHKRNADSYDRIAYLFWDGNIYNTCEKLFDFCKTKIKYDIESEDIQTVCSPQRILQKGRGDCKHYAGFINGILSSLKRQGYDSINNHYRYASYRVLESVPTHVFAVVKTREGEIWIDPVLDYFNERRSYTYAVDRKINEEIGAIGQINSYQFPPCECEGRARIGIAPVVVYAAVQLVSLAIKVFGNNYTVQSSVRWLIQLYQQFVLGQSGITATNANQALAQTTMQWFSNQLGVPVLDRTMFDLLKGYADPNDAGLHNQTYEQRATNYKTHTGTENVTFEQALNAAKLTDRYLYAMPPGSWKNIPPASALAPAAVQAPGSSPTSAGVSPLLIIGAAGLLLFSVLNPPKRKPRRA